MPDPRPELSGWMDGLQVSMTGAIPQWEQLASDLVPCFNARAEAVHDTWADIEADVLAEHGHRFVHALLVASTDIESAILKISEGSSRSM